MDTSLHHWKRKFPGPAGLLPITTKGHDDSQFTKMELSAMLKHELFVENFTKGTWSHMKYVIPNVNEILKNHSLKTLFDKVRLPDQQIPFRAEYVVGLITTLTNNREDAFVDLEDETGCIGVAICRELYKKYRREIIIGSALILRNVVVFSTMIGEDRDMWNLFVNVSNANLEYIFSSKDEGVTIDVTKRSILEIENDGQSLKPSTIEQDNSLFDGCSLEDIFGDMSDDEVLMSVPEAGDRSSSSLKSSIPETSLPDTNISASTTASRLRQEDAGKMLESRKTQIDVNKNHCSKIFTHSENYTNDVTEETTSAYFSKVIKPAPLMDGTRDVSEVVISNSRSVVNDACIRTASHVSQKQIVETWNEKDFEAMLADLDDEN